MYIRFFGNGGLWFRPYGGSLLKSAKVTQTLLPHHSAPRLGSVCPNAGLNPWAAVMGHPWPRTANPASCRVTHGFKPAFGQRGFTGRLRSRSKTRAKAAAEQGLSDLWRSKCGRGLAPDSSVSATTCMTDAPPSGASPTPTFLTAFGFQDQVGYRGASLIQADRTREEVPPSRHIPKPRAALP